MKWKTMHLHLMKGNIFALSGIFVRLFLAEYR